METKDNNRPFVREHIIPSKEKKQKEFLRSLWRMFVRGAVFGIAAGLFFVMTEHFLDREKEVGEYQKLSDFIVDAHNAEKGEKQSSNDGSQQDTVNLESTEKKDMVKRGVSDAKNTENIKKTINGIDDYEKRIKQWNQSIVSISIQSEWADGQVVYEESVGFGIAIEKDDSKLYFLTLCENITTQIDNYLYAEFFDGAVCPAKVIGKDRDAGIAIISVNLDEIPRSIQEKIEIMKMGETGQMQTGTSLVLLGKPNGTLYSADIGIISGMAEKEYIMDYSLDIYPTNIIKNENGSGVAVSWEGKLLGIFTDKSSVSLKENTVRFSGIPSLKRIIKKIINREPIVFCGIRAENIPQQKSVDMGITNGIYVMGTEPNSPAARSGIKTGDIIQTVEDTEISSVVDFYTKISEYEQNKPISIHAVRVSGGKKKENKYIVRLKIKE